MPSISSMFRDRGRSPERVLKKIVFVGYGTFDSNSGGHIAGFARELAGMGYAVGVAARGPIGGAYAFGPPAFEMIGLDDLRLNPEAAMAFDGGLEPERTMLVCWTPRKASRRALAKARRRHPIPFVVHFEDNEDLLTELRGTAGELDPEADAQERRELIGDSAGATFIEARLHELLPPALPSLLLEPGVDLELFGAPLPPQRRRSLLRALGVRPDATVLVYCGNVHRANQAEMLELYSAIGQLNAQGRSVTLLRTGKDDVDMAVALGADPAEAGVVSLGVVERPLLVDLLKCADLFVQPGAPGPFNDYRLPSKIPEFMAVGRPLVLPATNVGLRVSEGEEALLLRAGSAEEIAARVGMILDDPQLAARLAAGAKGFAARAWRWDVQGGKLAAFLEQLARPAA